MGCGAAIAGVVSAGVGVAGATGAFAPGTPPPPNYGEISRDAQQAQIDLLPSKYAAESQYDPMFAALQNNIAYGNLFGTAATTTHTDGTSTPAGWYDAKGNLVSTNWNAFGHNGHSGGGGSGSGSSTGYTWRGANTTAGTDVTHPGSPGQIAMMEQAAPRLIALGTQVNTATRTADINDVRNLGPAARDAIRAYNPQATSLLDTLDNQANEQLKLNGALDPFTKRMLQQDVRTGQAARGMGTGVTDAAEEAYYQDATREARRSQNQNFAGQVVGAEQAYYGDPFMQILQRSSGQSSIPQVGYTANQPSSIGNTNGAYDLAEQGYAAQNQAAIAGYNSQQQSMASLMKGLPTYLSAI